MSKIKKNRARRVFLSYTQSDAGQAEQLRRLLDARGDSTVFTVDSLSASAGWQGQVREALRECDVFVLLVSPAALASPWVLYELGAAWSLGKPVIPVLTDRSVAPKLPVSLERTQFVNI